MAIWNTHTPTAAKRALAGMIALAVTLVAALAMAAPADVTSDALTRTAEFLDQADAAVERMGEGAPLLEQANDAQADARRALASGNERLAMKLTLDAREKARRVLRTNYVTLSASQETDDPAEISVARESAMLPAYDETRLERTKPAVERRNPRAERRERAARQAALPWRTDSSSFS